VAIKGALKIYYKQVQYIRQANRVVKDFEETEQPPPGTSSGTS